MPFFFLIFRQRKIIKEYNNVDEKPHPFRKLSESEIATLKSYEKNYRSITKISFQIVIISISCLLISFRFNELYPYTFGIILSAIIFGFIANWSIIALIIGIRFISYKRDLVEAVYKVSGKVYKTWGQTRAFPVFTIHGVHISMGYKYFFLGFTWSRSEKAEKYDDTKNGDFLEIEYSPHSRYVWSIIKQN